MARICDLCRRGAITGNQRSHSKVASKRMMSINLQTKKLNGKKILVCTSCIKTINKLKKNRTI
ncbi:MAG: 50S ribosomal protein L28 [Candidatus Komeilibacteria bacterium CG11_big_fil_rev_8_21_14_0_20_36_20]|uniref:Large ribosomal subunit protein bL28 n=1 Tax=Candidatus Komeilibacteria bacterium CG11_big_fil_rev_8_21_14_0_20_36_20 TaxID=1974477 RepID=A0A2H0NFW0_9BACT|nr:MAG: 50S ribosomal protein L28 [Candidatus Komeilibacteria bacterium CG11_big_fil_rev_8_21_14_0_20_36_20]PIR81415.1 MAG: 50S ribosomal protein L28 [Candidatus Komeilibacteria bacterium CG10_big_fil_rev_8_21_14_0_10_36_65]PJC55141.1 MAG: 50S ribosomal protein L28 [Candidatus Komeilibacteria bacterium CG_4_9_14_0_2_um_filter_36_13]